jgi:hypothetical protein
MFSSLRSSLQQAKSISCKAYRQNNVSTHLAAIRFKSSQAVQEVVSFPSSKELEETSVILNSKEHAVGYLSKILNARCYDVAIETQLQEAKSLSMVSYLIFFRLWNMNDDIPKSKTY